MERELRSAVVAALTVLNARFPRIRSRVGSIPSFFAAWVGTEAAGLFLGWRIVRAIATWRRGGYRSAQGRLAIGVEAANIAGFAAMIQQGRRAGQEFEAALAPHLSPADLAERPATQRKGAIMPVFNGASRVVRTHNVAYVDGGRWRNTLDIYRERRPRQHSGDPRPAIIEVHGGGWVVGNKTQQGLGLLNHMTAQGWTGFNINYRLAPKAKFPEQLIDCKRALAWVRTHADELGIDPDFIVVTGGSAGGYLTAMLALTANDPEFQPGFEEVDTSVAAAVPFYGVYDLLDEGGAMAKGFTEFMERTVVGTSSRTEVETWRRFSPIARVHADAPPMMMIHGTQDTLVPVEQGRRFVERLDAASDHAVVYVELAGANHAFDVFPSPRAVHSTEYVERFLSGVRSGAIK